MNHTNLKLVAIVTMLIDHTGAILFPQFLELRVIGRIAFPIFCFLLVEGYYHTRDVRKYILRLGAFALLAEIPFDIAFNGALLEFSHQNVFITLTLGLIGVLLYDRYKLVGVIGFLVLSGVNELLQGDYGSYGIWIILLFAILRGNYKKQALGFTMVTGVLVLGAFIGGSDTLNQYIQYFQVLAVPFIYFYNGEKGLRLKYIFYIFYPAHLIVLSFIDRAL